MEVTNPSLPIERFIAGQRARKKYFRRLGPLETMYHVYYKRGMDTYDIFAQMVHLKCLNYVDTKDVDAALRCLMKKHPMLRMRIEEHDEATNTYSFVEMNDDRINLYEKKSKNFEKELYDESCSSFDIVNGPMWRLTILRDEADEREESAEVKITDNDFRFIFAFHHSLTDGMYLRQLFADFIEYLDLVQRDIIYYDEIKEHDFLPPIEKLLPLISKDNLTNSEKNYRVSDCSATETDRTIEALDAYEKLFAQEINFLGRNEQQTGSFRSYIPRHESLQFLSQCKQHQVTVTGACVAAACKSLALLLQPSIPDSIATLNIPVEVMVNMRRYVVDRSLYEAYPGVAAMHVAISIKVPIRQNLDSPELFWHLAKQCTDGINNIVASGEPLLVMTKEAEQVIKMQKDVGKSQYVICLTNMSTADGVVKSEQKDRFQVVNFPSMTQIGIDDMPIFYVGIHSIFKQLHVDVGHCCRYTSKETATKFSWNLMSSLSPQNRL